MGAKGPSVFMFIEEHFESPDLFTRRNKSLLYQGTNSPGPYFESRPYRGLNSSMSCMPTAQRRAYTNDPCGLTGSPECRAVDESGPPLKPLPSLLRKAICIVLLGLCTNIVVHCIYRGTASPLLSSHVWNYPCLKQPCEPTVRERTLHNPLGPST